MTYAHLLRLSCCSAIGLLGSAAMPSYAQVANPDGEKKLETVTVTATKREQTLQEVPVAVTVVSGERLDQTGVGAVETIVDVTPSLTFTKGNNESNSSLTIRGIGTTVFSAGVESSVSIVIDEVVMGADGAGFQDLIDVERVEVLRGPQSTLFGKNASAGLVSVTTKAPSDTLTGSLETMFTDDGEYQHRGTLSGPLGEKAGWRLSGFHKDFEGNTTNFFNGEKLNGYESWGARGKLAVEMTDALSLTLIGDYRQGQSAPTGTIHSFVDPARDVIIAPAVPGVENQDVNVDGLIYSETDQWGMSAKAEYTFPNDYVLTSITAYREWTFDNNSDVDLTSLPPMPGPLFTWNVNRGTRDLSQWSQEIRLTSPSYDKFDYILGAFFYNNDTGTTFSRRWEQVIANVITGRSSQFEGGIETTNMAAFASGNYHVNDSLTLFSGLRYLYEEIEWDVFRDPANVLVPGDIPLPGNPGLFADFTGSFDDTALVGNIGARYQVGDLGNVYATYSRGYKGAGYDVNFASVEGDPVDPEEVDAYEVGLKMSSPGGRLSANVALFYTDYRNYQAQSRGESEIAPFILRNAGDVSTSGIETEFFLAATDLLDLSLGVSLIDAKIESFPGAPCYANQTPAQGCVSGAQDLSGADLPNSPDVRITGFARQTIPFSNLPFDGFVQANAVYQDDVQYALNQDPRTIQDGYTIVNAALGIESRDGQYRLQVFGRNLTDQFYAGELFPSPSQGGRVTQQIPRAAGRYFGVQGSVSF